MCKHTEKPSYYHVIDEDNGEHIATYTDPRNALDRLDAEAKAGRPFCCVTTNPTTPCNVRAGNRWYHSGDLIHNI